MAGVSGSPVSQSQTIKVSPWLSNPTAAISYFFSNGATASFTVRTISYGSCSTQPGLGKRAGKGTECFSTKEAFSSTTTAVVWVVPWSIPRMYFMRSSQKGRGTPPVRDAALCDDETNLLLFAVSFFDLGNHLLALGNPFPFWHAFEAIVLTAGEIGHRGGDHGNGESNVGCAQIRDEEMHHICLRHFKEGQD